jgi:phospholipid/cholesterol/gamma-HCH transport system permease protein
MSTKIISKNIFFFISSLNVTFKKNIFLNSFVIFCISSTITYQSYILSIPFDIHYELPKILAPILIIDISPIFIGITLSMQLSFFIISDIKIMKFNNLFNIILMMGININYLFFYIFILNNIFIFVFVNATSVVAGFIGMYIICFSYFDITISSYILNIFHVTKIHYIFFSQIKVVIFGFLSSIISIYFGLIVNTYKSRIIKSNPTILILTFIIITNNLINKLIFIY